MGVRVVGGAVRRAWLLLPGLVALGCSGPLGAPLRNLWPSEQRAACEDWVDRVNELEPCLHVHYEAANLCSGVDRQPVEIVGWFACLAEHTSCEGGVATFEPDSCPPPIRAAEVPG